MIEDLRLRNYFRSDDPILPKPSPTSLDISTGRRTNLVRKRLRHYQLYLLNERKLAWQTFQVRMAGLKFLYTQTLKQKWFESEIAKPRVRRKLPTVLSREEIQAFLNAAAN